MKSPTVVGIRASMVLLLSLLAACGSEPPNPSEVCEPPPQNQLEDCYVNQEKEKVEIRKARDIEQLCNSNCGKIRLLSVNYVAKLETLEPLGNPLSIGTLDIFENPDLKSLEGLQSTPILHSLTLPGQNNIESLEGLNFADSFSALEVSGADFRSFKGLGNVDHLKVLDIHHNEVLRDLSGLEGVQSIDKLRIRRNQNLTSTAGVNALGKLTVPGRSFQLANNPNLRRLVGFNQVERMPGDLIIHNNERLTSLEGFQNLQSLDDLEISGNKSLTRCEIDRFLEGVEVRGSRDIRENGGKGDCK